MLKDVGLTVRPGRVHALLGANGAGKSTLISCLSGALRADSGTIHLDGIRLDLQEPRQGIVAGISVIYQHLSVVDALTVADNVFLGSERVRFGVLVDTRRQIYESADVLARLGVDLDENSRVSHLEPAERQLIEIAKAVRRQARVLVLDEPTASLSDREKRRLLALIRQLKERDLCILYVTHLLDEVFETADDVTVLRDGAVALSAPVADTKPDDLIAAIAGRSTNAAQRPAGAGQRAPGEPGASPVLTLRSVMTDRGGPIDLSVGRGEVVGIYGLLGSGRSELLETVAGVRQPQAGRMHLDGAVFRPKSPAAAIGKGIALVPSDRRKDALFLPLSSADNVLFAASTHLARAGVRRRRVEAGLFGMLASRLRLQPSAPKVSAWRLSGGNQQKLAIGRWITGDPPVRVLLLDEPTQGVDVGARSELYRMLRHLASDQGIAVLFTSSSPQEIQTLAERAVVLARGEIVAELPRGQIDVHLLLSLANELEQP